MHRREFLKLSALRLSALSAGALAFGPFGAACSRLVTDGDSVPPVFKELAATLAERSNPGLSVFLGASEFIAGTTERIPMRLAAMDGADLIATTATVYVGKRKNPLPMTYQRFASDSTLGFHETHIPVPKEGGIIDLAVVAKARGTSSYGFAVIDGKVDGKVPSIGEQAIAVATSTDSNLCTRTPPCGMHAISLDAALGLGKPVVLIIGSPKLCSSGVCGPVVDEAIHIRNDKAAFLHVEPYVDDSATTLSQVPTAWGLDSEPWTFIIDANAKIAARFEGAVTAGTMDEALNKIV
ncbi:MAG: hypothetical protein ABIS18_01990 [Actinomycetota bacterium]